MYSGVQERGGIYARGHVASPEALRRLITLTLTIPLRWALFRSRNYARASYVSASYRPPGTDPASAPTTP